MGPAQTTGDGTTDTTGPTAAASLLAQLVEEIREQRIRVVDLTQLLHAGTPVASVPREGGDAGGFSIDQIAQYDERSPSCYWNALALSEHTGTHLDAPIHWITGRHLSRVTCDSIPPARFIGPACVIDVTGEVAGNVDFLLEPRHILAWHEQHGEIPAGAWVLVRTGWSKRHDAASYLNEDTDGPHSPGISRQAAELLAARSELLGVGVETADLDAGQAARFDPPYPCHHVLHGAGKLGLAGLCNLDQLPATGAVVIAAPLKIINGSGSPVRALALVQA